MCGIAGLLSAKGVDSAVIGAMTSAISHRGPDDSGVWIDTGAQVGLGHRRLSIVDLSPLGHQPMTSVDGRYVIVYNGEIYNHAELRAELDATGQHAWRGHSDTETLLEAIANWGLERTLEKCVGMFAIALWDRSERNLKLVRDRFGEKPLYYGWVGGDFAFASELKAMRAHPRFDNPVSRSALGLFTSRIYIPAPLSIFERIYKLQPGCVMTVSLDAVGSPAHSAPEVGERGSGRQLERYWSYRQVVADGLRDPITSEGDALAALDEALSASISGQSMADVPVGAFLSGGIDSSSVVALYQRQSSRPIRTFSIGFEEEGYNEAPYAKEVARHFGTDHNELYLSAGEAQKSLPLLPAMYDEPFADPSQIPTHIVSRFAREQVTVALSGDGGDELFGGYNRYFVTAKVWSRMQKLPRPMRAAVGRSLGGISPSSWNSIAAVVRGGRQPPYFGIKAQKAFRIMGAADGLPGAFDGFTDEWYGQRSPVLGFRREDAGVEFDLNAGPDAPDITRMMYCDAMSYLPDDILCKVDRAAMAVSLETRVPFLDHRLASVAARIPLEMKVSGGKGKMILRKLLYREAPAELFERPKAGFGIPVGKWLTGELRPWAESLLDPRRLRDEGYFDPTEVGARWDELVTGKRDAGFSIWTILMFQAWLDELKNPATAEPIRLAS